MARAKARTGTARRKKIRVGVIGAGWFANYVHYPCLSELPGVTLVAISDLAEAKLLATADKYNVRGRYTDYKEMIEKEKLDAVYVIMLPHILLDIVLHCLNAGLHVFMEKPPGARLYETELMARTARRNKCLTMVGFMTRFCPMTIQAKQRVEARGPINTCVGTIYKNARMADGVVDPLTMDGIHMVDALRWIAGSEARSVTSCVSAYDDQAPNTYHALIRFENDATGILRTGWATGGRLRTVEMHTRGMSALLNIDLEAVFVSSERSAGTSDPPRTEVVTTQEMSGSDEFHRYYGYYDESRHFMECIRTGRRPMTNLEDAARSMALLDEICHNSI